MDGGRTLVVARPAPFAERVVRDVPSSVPIGAIVREIAGEASDCAVVCVDGEVVPPSRWSEPIAGRTAAIVVRPRGGDALRIALSFGLSVLSLGVGAWAGPALASALGVTSKLGTTLIGAAVASAVSVVGGLAVTALVPPAQPEAPSGRSRVWYLDRASNDARPWTPVPRVLGRHRLVPPLAAAAVPEGDGRTGYLRLAVCWGYGPVELSQLRIGSTPIDQIPEVEHEFFPGTPGVLPQLSLYSNDYHVENIGIQLTNSGGPLVYRSASDCSEIIVILEFPRGLFEFEKQGTGRLDVQIEVATSPAGQNSWTVLETIDLRRDVQNRFRVSRRYQISSAPVDVRLRRLTRDRKDIAKVDEVFWAALVSVRRASPFALPGVAISALRVRADERNTGSLQAISGVVSSIVADYDHSTGQWTNRVSRNPASLARAVLQGNGAARTYPDAKLDLQSWVDWHDYCRARQLTCDLVVDWDNATQWDVLQLVAATGDAIVLPVDGKWRPVIDRPRAAPIQLFTPRNTLSFAWRRDLYSQVHGFRVRFPDETSDWQIRERIVYADGYGPNNATRLEQLEIPGITNPDLVWRHARRRLAEAIWRSEVFELEVGWEYLAATVGDLVEISHDAISVGVGAGRVVSVQASGGQVTSIRIDAAVALEGDRTYVVVARSAQSVRTHRIAQTSGTVVDLPLAAPIPAAEAPAVGDLVAVGELGVQTVRALVRAVRPIDDSRARLELVAYHDGIYQSDAAAIPPWRPALPTTRGDPPVLEAVPLDRGAISVAVRSASPVAVALELEARAGDAPLAAATWPAAVTDGRLELAAPAEGSVVVRGRWRYVDGAVSPWAVTAAQAAVACPPPTGAWLADGVLVWHTVPRAGAVYEVRAGPPGVEWARASVLGRTTDTRLPVTVPLHATDYLIAAQWRGAVSAPYRLSYRPPQPGVPGEIVWRWSAAAQGWPGIRRGLELRPAEPIVVDSGRQFDPPEAAAFVPETRGFFEGDPAELPEQTISEWFYQSTCEVPRTVTAVDGSTTELSGAEILRPIVIGGEASVEIAIDLPYRPWRSGRTWKSGRLFARSDRAVWVSWPRELRAVPGTRILFRARGTRRITDLTIVAARQTS